MTAYFPQYNIHSNTGSTNQPQELTPTDHISQLSRELVFIIFSLSDVLILGVQYPKAESGEATFITPATQAKNSDFQLENHKA